ncbi:hypothetical protein GY45DRAFT_173831 [Cubamyces sp. BRFM 1775]|nr:hypothetical protein GY45DRAFT_173831 [Cubamyces sp. BRFM 1775]
MAFSEVRTYGLPPPNVRSYSYYMLLWAHHQGIAITFERTALTPTCKTAWLPLISHPPVLFTSLVAEQLSLYLPCLTTGTSPHHACFDSSTDLRARTVDAVECLPYTPNNAYRNQRKPYRWWGGNNLSACTVLSESLGLGLSSSPLVCVLLRVCQNHWSFPLYCTSGSRTAHFLCV